MKKRAIQAIAFSGILLMGCGQLSMQTPISQMAKTGTLASMGGRPITRNTDSGTYPVSDEPGNYEEPATDSTQDGESGSQTKSNTNEGTPQAATGGAKTLFDSPRGYSGYLDEYTEWNSYKYYVNQDYDADGKTDHVYLTDKGETYNLDLMLGSGAVLTLAEHVDYYYDPFVFSVDLEGDGSKEIVTQFISFTSTDPRFTSTYSLYVLTDNGYSPAVFPFGYEVTDYYTVNYSFTTEYKRTDDGIYFYVKELDTGTTLTRDELGNLYDEYADAYADQTMNASIYLEGTIHSDNKEILVFDVEMFDKWSPCVLQFGVSKGSDGYYNVEYMSLIPTEYTYTAYGLENNYFPVVDAY